MLLSFLTAKGVRSAKRSGIKARDLPAPVDKAIDLEIEARQIACGITLFPHDVIVEVPQAGPRLVTVILVVELIDRFYAGNARQDYFGSAAEPCMNMGGDATYALSLIHISEPTRLGMISYAVFCLK